LRPSCMQLRSDRGLPWLWPKLKAESANEFWVLRGHVCFSYARRGYL
jgi:hypothetical protein